MRRRSTAARARRGRRSSSATATPGAPNVTPGYLGSVADTEFLPQTWIFTDLSEVAVASATPGATIRYATNGSANPLANGMTYASPVHLETTTVMPHRCLRATGSRPTSRYQRVSLPRRCRAPGERARYGSEPTGPTGPNQGSVAGQMINFGMDPTIVNPHRTQRSDRPGPGRRRHCSRCRRSASRPIYGTCTLTPRPAFTRARATTALPGNALPPSE